MDLIRILSLLSLAALAARSSYGEPLSPERERQSFQLADDDLVIELVASEPDVVSPVAIAWDARGRLFVAEMMGYPETGRRGRIKRLEDTNGDGQYDKAIVFADDLGFPTSVLPYEDGVLVTDAPNILFLQDTDDDGSSDKATVLWTGFHPGSQQLRANALHWGLDNWIYGANGRCGGEISQRDRFKPISIRGRDFRFDVRQKQFEPIVGQSQFGLVHDSWGRRFLSWNQIPVRQAVIPEPYASARNGLAEHAVIDCAAPDDDGAVFPISPPPPQFNVESANFYNALCGLTVFRGDALGPAYHENAFVCESLTNLVTRRTFVGAGPALQTQRPRKDREFLAARDPWFHPVFCTTGPDGALYVVDFYRKYVEHPIYVASQEVQASINWDEGSGQGRIWRIRRKDANGLQDRRQGQPATTPIVQLVENLAHPVGWWRDQAQRSLVQRQDFTALPLLRKAVRDSPSPFQRLHGLWVLRGLGALDGATIAHALTDEHPRLREHALRLAERQVRFNPQVESAFMNLVDDKDPGVRFQLALSLGEIETDAAWPVLKKLVKRDCEHSWIALATLSSAGDRVDRIVHELARQEAELLREPTPAQFAFLSRLGESLLRAQAAVAPENRDARQKITIPESGVGPLAAVALYAGFVHGTDSLGESRGPLRTIFATDKSKAEDLIAFALGTSRDDKQPLAIREAAVDVLGLGKVEQVVEPLIALVSPDVPRSLQRLAVTSLAQLDDADGYRRLFKSWSKHTTQVRQLIVKGAVLSRSARLALAEALETNVVHRLEVPVSSHLALIAGAQGRLKKRLSQALDSNVSEDRAKVVGRYLLAVGKDSVHGDPLRGAALFREHCLSCHTVLGVGGTTGPNLSSVGGKSPQSLLVDILDPSREVAPNYLAYRVDTTDGRIIVGVILAETARTLTLGVGDDQRVTVQHSDVDSIVATGKSFMADGFETQLKAQGLADVIAFLRQPSRRLLEISGSKEE